MKNPSGNNLEKLVFKMFDQMVKGSDKYETKEGSTWLIFTEDKKWIFEFTKDSTLWFNYNLFQSELELISKNCSDERDLIKKWFELKFLNINGVKDSCWTSYTCPIKVKDTIQNGVKHTRIYVRVFPNSVEDAIQNGVRHTLGNQSDQCLSVEDTIQNGVKNTICTNVQPPHLIEDTIQNGVKHTKNGDWLDQDKRINNIVKDGVKNTSALRGRFTKSLEDVIQQGKKLT